jgi:hypothetical protein
MAKFQKSDHVTWNSDVGRVNGTVEKIHTRDFEFIGRKRRATADAPQYEVKSDKTSRPAAHKEAALKKIP